MDSRTVLRIAWYRFGATFRRRSGGYLALILLIGLVGGLAMASIAGARRTQSSYPTALASANPSDLNVSVYNPATNGGAGPDLTAKIAQLPGVKRVRDVAALAFAPLTATGAPRFDTLGDVTTIASLDGEFLHQDRLVAVQGRLANQKRADEIVMTASAARVVGARLGQIVPLGFYTNAQESLPDFGTPSVAPRIMVRAHLVGIVVLDNQVVQDDVDQAYGFTVLTEALLREADALEPKASSPVAYAVQLDHGARDVSAVEDRIVALIPPGLIYTFHISSGIVAEVELAIKPESVALGAFGVIAALVALVLAAQAIARQLRSGAADRQVLRALGAGPSAIAGDELIGILVTILLGALLAAGVAVALSPLAPLGPVRPVYPDRGIAFDWTVLGLGLTVLLVGLGAVAGTLSYLGSPGRMARSQPLAIRPSTISRSAEAAGMPLAGVVGLRFAIQRGRDQGSAPVRSALLGTMLAVVLVVATLTFASGLGTLIANPSLYGWNWSYVLNPTNDVPPAAITLLSHDRDVAAWTPIAAYTSAEINGQTVPFLITDTRPTVAPPTLSGHGLDGNGQIVLGAATLALLHRHIGDTVRVSLGTPAAAPIYIPPTPMRIVGTATFPAIGFSSFVSDHTSMGTGALVSTGIIPPAFEQATNNPDPNLNGPQLVFVRLKNGISLSAGRAALERIAAVANRVFAADRKTPGNNVAVLGVQRPAQIVNYRSIGSTPVLLAVALALGAVVALALALVASVRLRRRDLALLKALGFTPRQLAAIVAWQSTIAALVGIAAGVPIGIALGRELWVLFARNINAVPRPTVPVLSVVFVGLGTFVFANVVAALPGRIAARTPTALILRAE